MKIAYRGFMYESISNDLIVYHGTNKTFNKFEKTKGSISTIFGAEQIDRDGYFFTPNIEFAKEFGANIIKCKLHVGNTLDMNYGVSNEEDIEKLVSVGAYDRYLWNLQPSTVWEAFDGENSIAPFILKAGYDSVEMVEPDSNNKLQKVFIVFDSNKIEILK